MRKEISYINEWYSVFEEHIKRHQDFIKSQEETHLSYVESYKDRSQPGFNCFMLASDTYFRENYHSYILKAFLSPRAEHNQGLLYLNLFIEAINRSNKLKTIDKDSFVNAQVFREWKDIDILIKDDVSKKAIIIENKIYNAVDQKRQLPRYLDTMEELDYEVLAIVYLPLSPGKQPSMYGWSEEDKNRVNSLLCIIPAYYNDKNNVSLYNDWIEPSWQSSEDDNAFMLSHYEKLIKYLATNIMDTVSLKKFHESLLVEDNYETAISIKNMLNDIPTYLAIRIEDRYKDAFAPFEKLWRNKERDVVFSGFEYDGGYYKIDVWCDLKGYTLHFWETRDEKRDIESIFKAYLPELSDFNEHNGKKSNLKKRFSIKEEGDVLMLIDKMLKTLKVMI